MFAVKVDKRVVAAMVVIAVAGYALTVFLHRSTGAGHLTALFASRMMGTT